MLIHLKMFCSQAPILKLDQAIPLTLAKRVVETLQGERSNPSEQRFVSGGDISAVKMPGENAAEFFVSKDGQHGIGIVQAKARGIFCQGVMRKQ